MTRRTGSTHVPALDGLRGLFMAAFIAYHFGATFLEGGWVAINMFFVLSGFLITRLLTQEFERHASIDFWRFYKRRGRRILPGLFVLLGTVTTWTWLFAPEELRSRFGGDIIATLGFVMNWRLIAQGDEYFGGGAAEPPLRHAWTLAIEEQYYLVIPLLLTAIFIITRARRARAGVFLGLAVAMTVVTAYVAEPDVANLDRLYYGTDTRAASLLLGSALGIFVARRGGRSGLRLGRTSANALATIGIAASVLPLVLINASTPWMYTRGGMLLFAAGAGCLLVVIAQPGASPVERLFDWSLARWYGRISYPMYLWHWPIHLLLGSAGIAGSVFITGIVGFALTTLVAWTSDKYVERPVLVGGIRGLLPRLRRPMIAVLAPVVALLAICSLVLLPTSSVPRATTSTKLPTELTPGQPDYQPGRPSNFAVLGDSVPWFLVKRYPQQMFPGTRPVDLTEQGCDLLPLPLSSTTGIKNAQKACVDHLRDWPAELAASKSPVLMVFGSPLLASAHRMPDGSVGQPGEPAYERYIMSTYSDIWKRAKAAGAEQIQVVNVPCRAFDVSPDSEEYKKLMQEQPRYIPEYNNPRLTNDVLARWVSQTPGAQLIDLHAATCPGGNYLRQIDGMAVFNDGLHFSPEITPTIWRWLVGQMSSRYRG